MNRTIRLLSALLCALMILLSFAACANSGGGDTTTAAGGTVKLACLQNRPRIVFDITQVYRVFEIFDNVNSALESFKS